MSSSSSSSQNILEILKLLVSSSSSDSTESTDNSDESKSIKDKFKITHQEEFGVEWMQWDQSTYQYSEPDADFILPSWIKRNDDNLIVTLGSEVVKLNDVSNMEKLVANIYKIHNLLRKQLKSASDNNIQHVLKRYDVSWFINNIPVPQQLIDTDLTQRCYQEFNFAPLDGDGGCGDGGALPDFLEEPIGSLFSFKRMALGVNFNKLMSRFPPIQSYEQSITESGPPLCEFLYGFGRWNQAIWLILHKMLRTYAEKQGDYPLETIDAFFNMYNGRKINMILQRFREQQIITSTRRWLQRVYSPMLTEISENTFAYGQQNHADMIAPALAEIELNHRHLFYSRSPDTIKFVRELEQEFDRGIDLLIQVHETSK